MIIAPWSCEWESSARSDLGWWWGTEPRQQNTNTYFGIPSALPLSLAAAAVSSSSPADHITHRLDGYAVCDLYYAIHFPSYANTICGCILKSGAGINWSIDRSHGHRSDYVLFSGTRRRRGYPYTSLSAHCNYYYYCIAFGRCFGGAAAAAAARINSIAVVENNKNPSHRSQMSIRALFRSHIDHNVIHTVAEALGTCIHNTRMGWDRLNGLLCSTVYNIRQL